MQGKAMSHGVTGEGGSARTERGCKVVEDIVTWKERNSTIVQGELGSTRYLSGGRREVRHKIVHWSITLSGQTNIPISDGCPTVM